MSVSIIFAFNDDTKKNALAAGFREKTVLIRYETGYGEQAEHKVAGEIAEFGGASFIASKSYWGTGPD